MQAVGLQVGLSRLGLGWAWEQQQQQLGEGRAEGSRVRGPQGGAVSFAVTDLLCLCLCLSLCRAGLDYVVPGCTNRPFADLARLV